MLLVKYSKKTCLLKFSIGVVKTRDIPRRMEETCIICKEQFTGCCNEERLSTGEIVHLNCYKLIKAFGSIEKARLYYRMLAASVRVDLSRKGLSYHR